MSLSETQRKILGKSKKMARKKKVDRFLGKYKKRKRHSFDEEIQVDGIDKIAGKFGKDDIVEEDVELSFKEDKKESESKHKDEKADNETNISKLILDQLSDGLQETIEEETEHITQATMRAISLKYAQSSDQKFSDDLIIKALELIVDERTETISNTLFSDLAGEIEKADTKRIDFEKSYKEFLEVMYIAKKIQKDNIASGTIMEERELKSDFDGSNGFLSLPLEFYRKSMEVVALSEELTGKELRGMDIYSKFLENVAVVNLFKEDIFDIF